MGFGLFQQGKNLLPLDAGEAVEKVLNGITGFQVVKQAFYWHASSLEDRLAAKNLRVLHDDLAHEVNLIDRGMLGELNPTDTEKTYLSGKDACFLFLLKLLEAIMVPDKLW